MRKNFKSTFFKTGIKDLPHSFYELSIFKEKPVGKFIGPRWKKFIHKNGLFARTREYQRAFSFLNSIQNMHSAFFGAH